MLRAEGALMLRSVAEAAELLGVNQARVRAMIAAGLITATRIGGRWLVDAVSIERYQRGRSSSGRMFEARQAWGLLMLEVGLKPSWLTMSEISRLRRMLRERGLAKLARRLGHRAEKHFFYAHPADLPRLLKEPQAVLTGLSGIEHHGLELVAADKAEFYYPAAELTRLQKKYHLQLLSPPNVLIRAVSANWPFLDGLKVSPAAVVAIDLLESDDERTRRAGAELLKRWGSKGEES